MSEQDDEPGREGSDETPVLDYGVVHRRRGRMPAIDPTDIVLEPGEPRNAWNFFPPYCCACFERTNNLWTAPDGLGPAENLKIPLCRKCARRWSMVSRLSLPICFAAASVVSIIVLLNVRLRESERPYAWLFPILTTAGFGSILTLFATKVLGILVYPACVTQGRYERNRHVVFRRAAYQRFARAWIDAAMSYDDELNEAKLEDLRKAYLGPK